jgi:MFS family permease
LLSKLTGGASTRIVVMALVLALANQLSGINAIIFYAKQIFEHIVDKEQALMNTYYLGLLQMVVTFVSGFMIDNYGRRSLMLAGTGIVVFSLISAFLFDALVPNS